MYTAQLCPSGSESLHRESLQWTSEGVRKVEARVLARLDSPWTPRPFRVWLASWCGLLVKISGNTNIELTYSQSSRPNRWLLSEYRGR